MKRSLNSVSLLVCAFIIIAGTIAQASSFELLANSVMHEDRPTAETSKLLKDELLFQRATQTYLWAMPLINTMGMKTGSEKVFGAGYNVLPIWKDRLNARTLVTTPNSDVLYAMSYVDLGTDGPLVLDAPPMLQSILLDFWQRPIPGPTIRGRNFLGDIGFFGPDKGQGGKFLLLPPGYTGIDSRWILCLSTGDQQRFHFLEGLLSESQGPEACRRFAGKDQNLSTEQRSQSQEDGIPECLAGSRKYATCQ